MSNASTHVYLKHRNKALEESGRRRKAENVRGKCLTCGQELSSDSNYLFWDLMNQEHGVSWDRQEDQSNFERIHHGIAGIGGRGMEFYFCADPLVSTEASIFPLHPSTPRHGWDPGTLVRAGPYSSDGAGWRSTGCQGQRGGIPSGSLSFAESGGTLTPSHPCLEDEWLFVHLFVFPEPTPSTSAILFLDHKQEDPQPCLPRTAVELPIG